MHFSNAKQNEEQHINDFTGLSLSQLKQILSTDDKTINTQAEIAASGQIPQGMTSVNVRFPALLQMYI